MKAQNLGKVLAISFLMFSLGACQKAGNKSNAPTLQTVTDAQYSADQKSVVDTEAALQTVGLKFQAGDAQSSNAQTASFDDSFRKDYMTKNPNAKPADEIAPLKAYVAAAEAYVKKYSMPVQLKHEDGKTELKAADTTTIAQIRAKLQAAQAEMKSLAAAAH